MDQKTGLLGKFACKRFNKVAIIYDNSSEAFVDGMNAFKNRYVKESNEIVAIESFKKGDADFRSQLLKIKLQNPEAVYIGGYAAEISLIVKQMEEQKIKTQILTDDAILDPSFLKTVGNLSEGIIFGTTRFDKDIAKDFWTSYFNLFGAEPTIFSAQGYDTLKILNSIIEDKCSNGNSTCLKNELYKVEDYLGVSGKTSFDENGDVKKEVIIKTIKNGQFVPYNSETGN